jgi:predicted small lipoprotein YifL
MNSTFRLVFIAAALATLAGCGNKGPLMLPTPPAEPVVAPEAPAETPAGTPAEPATNDGTTPPEQTPVPATSDGGGNG